MLESNADVKQCHGLNIALSEAKRFALRFSKSVSQDFEHFFGLNIGQFFAKCLLSLP